MFNQATQLLQTLSFPSLSVATEANSRALDTKFRRYYIDSNLMVVRAAIGIGIILTLAVCLMDAILMPPAFSAQAIPFRAMTMLLPMAGALAATCLVKERLRIPYVNATVALVVGVSTILVSGIAVRHGVQMVAWGMIFTTFNIYLVLGLNMRQSMMAGWPIFLFYLGISIFVAVPLHKMVYGSMFLAFSNVVGTYASHLMERNAREIFASKLALEKLARTDGLTGLYNRRTFDDHLHQVWKQAQREEKNIAIVLVDIDHFKLFNDCYGHQLGDQCIKAVANVLRTSANRPLDLVARYGGEEYAIILYDASASFLESFAGSLCDKVIDLDIAHKASDVSPSITVSVGAAITQASGTVTADQLLRRADDSLYESKNLGRNKAVIYRPEWGEKVASEPDLATYLS